MEGGTDHEKRDRADRQVDVEDPAPGEVVHEEAADERPDHGREAEDGAEVALVAAALARGDDVADHRDGRHHQTAASEALQRAEGDQLRHVLARPAERGADQEDDDRRLQQRLASVEVAELAVERPYDRRREQVCRDDPGQVLEAPEVSDDRRQRGRHDRLVQRGEQQHEQQRREDQTDARRAVDRRR
jgi:hypothetical protein